jgi:hypothetical protein
MSFKDGNPRGPKVKYVNRSVVRLQRFDRPNARNSFGVSQLEELLIATVVNNSVSFRA